MFQFSDVALVNAIMITFGLVNDGSFSKFPAELCAPRLREGSGKICVMTYTCALSSSPSLSHRVLEKYLKASWQLFQQQSQLFLSLFSDFSCQTLPQLRITLKYDV